MSGQAASIGSLVSALLLSDHRILRLSWGSHFARPIGWSSLREPTYLAFQPWAARFPDHVFDSAWRFLTASQQPSQGVLLTAMQSLIDEFMELRHGEVRLRTHLLSAWQQGLASRISAVPIQAAADVSFGVLRSSETRSNRSRARAPSNETSRWRSEMLPLLRPDEARVSDYVEREGLHETHLHLNGSTHAVICWLRALRDPYTETKEFVAAWTRGQHASRLRELIGHVNPELTPQLFYWHILTASRLRAWLVGASEDRLAPNTLLPVSCQSLCSADNEEWSIGLREQALEWRSEINVEWELSWMANLIAKLRQSPSVQLTQMFHAYLLLLNEHYRLLVQSEQQYGFDQFQKLTLTELREPAERQYRARFHAIHGPRSTISTIGYLEGRFAPKDSQIKAYKLFQSILGGYLDYLRDITEAPGLRGKRSRSLSHMLTELDQYFDQPVVRHRGIHRLALVAHFIKLPWALGTPHRTGVYRHYSLDLQLRRTTGILLSMLARWPRLQTWVRGVDAAGNELHAPPDVFAPVFRVSLQAGLTRRTYHAGEDFRHLLTGIATMWEALSLLDLRNGDRIGHGTAMGISPSLWIGRMPSRLTLSRGEWMLGVLAAWQLLRDVPEMQPCAHRLQRELEEIACQIFGRSLPARDLESAMALRGLSRSDLRRRMSGEDDSAHEPLSQLWRGEAELVRTMCEKQPHAVELLWRWLSVPEVQGRAEELIAKATDFLDAASYVRLQQALMQQVADRGVLVETLPSSNVRISQYRHVGEHHSLRWMKVPGHVEEGDPEIMVCLGSDDPGIFGADLETEFYLLYASLLQAGLSDSEALRRLSVLNERGRIYRFHHPALS